MRMRTVAALAAGVAALAELLSGGCGILSAPVSVPAAVAQNAGFSLEGTVVDNHGVPLEGVLLSQELNHYWWTPIKGGDVSHEPKLRRVDRTVAVNERGEDLHLTFALDGYHHAEYSFQARDADLVETPQGAWKNAPNFPVVLYPDKPDANLKTWRGNINYAEYPRAQVIDLNAVGSLKGPTIVRSADEAAAAPDGTLYLTLTPQTPQPINNSGELDPADINLPAEVTLHITGAGNGFVRIVPKLGYAPIQASDTAPAEGYAPTLTIDRSRLKEMRKASMNLIIEPREYFFFRANGRYGKGWFSWSQRVDEKQKGIAPAIFGYALWIQPQAGDVNLTTYVASSR